MLEVERWGPVGRLVLDDIAGSAVLCSSALGQVVVGGVHSKVYRAVSFDSRTREALSNLLPPPKTMWEWSATSFGETRGSIRAMPDVERHGIRQKAATLPARASVVAAAVKDFMLSVGGGPNMSSGARAMQLRFQRSQVM